MNVLDETLLEYPSIEVFVVEEHRFVLLLSFHGILSENSMNEQLYAILSKIQKNILHFLKLHVSVGVSEHHNDFMSLKKMYEECILALQAKFYSEFGGLHVYNRIMINMKKSHESANDTAIKLSEQYEILLGKEPIAEIRNAFIDLDYRNNQYIKKVKSYSLQWLQIPSKTVA